MSVVFQTFIDRLQGAYDKDTLGAAMSNVADSVGLTKFAYLGFRRPGPHLPVFVTSYPLDWVSHYQNRRYQDIDPVVMTARSRQLPFFWSEQSLGNRASHEQRRFFGEATEFGIKCGLTVPIHDSLTGMATVTFVSDRNPAQLRRDVEVHRQLIHLASIYFHVHVGQKLEDTAETDQPRLSPREVACLQWVVRGKSMWEIGEILSISRRTVVFHIENAKRKLDAVTLPQVVAVALQKRLIEF
jgi:LuxR family transcriptional regulator, activator of conjugal transfer of Ti plasmids